MKENKHKLSLLMILGILLLVVMQVFWIRAEYRSAVNTFNRETNLLFRSTIYQLTDSLIFSRIRLITMEDTLDRGRSHQLVSVGDSSGALVIAPDRPGDAAGISGGQGGGRESHSGQRLTRTLQFRLNEVAADSSFQRMMRDTLRRPSDMRFIFNMLSEGFTADTVYGYYLKALQLHQKYDAFQILSREHVWHPGAERLSHESSDTLSFTTSFVPVGRTAYAASFRKVPAFLFASLMPQIGFSLFILLVISLSFVLVHKTLKSQERLIEQKNVFISNVTHELKTPVATVGVALEAIKHFDVLKDPVKSMEYLDMATHELNRLSMMTEKILRTSVFDYQSDIHINKTNVCMDELAAKVVSSFRLMAERNQISLIFDVEGNTCLPGNEEHLTQMIYNLVDNAMKYASGGPEIIVKLAGTLSHVQLSVIDRGPGIADTHRTKIFERFYRVPSGNVHDVKGYGLGLHYVRGVVKAHGGSIWVEGSEGGGACFQVKLPKHG